MSDVEVLIVRGGETAAGQGRIVARIDPDIVVLQADAQSLPDLTRAGRFAVTRSPEVGTQTFGDESVLDELGESARLFVKAWLKRPYSKPDRPGEGLAWDAPGFEPPDRPSR